MKKDKKKLLIVDDEKQVLDALVRSFSVAKHFEFETKAVLELKEVVERDLENAVFDVCIFDLGFGIVDRNPDYSGFMALVARSELNRAEIRLVYSGHPQIQNVVQAMQLGATDFISKAECPPHRLVERVEIMLIERQECEVRNDCIYEYLARHHDDLGRRLPGRVVAITVADSGPAVVADGRSKLDVLLKYADWRRTQTTGQWPVVPHLHVVPSVFDR